ncbi:MAG TPA: O-antigen polymerase [Gemmatimonadaceae bacterium]|nr:O-antigen polymerase [Gemmatimonadaceae bacterium]
MVRELLSRKTGPFPRGPGILIAISIGLHVASLVQVLLGRVVDGGALFVTAQFLIALALLRLYDGRWVIQDIRVFFSLFLFLYGGALPLVVLFGITQPVPGIGGAAFMYGTAFLGFNLVQWWYKQPFVDVPRKAFDRIVPRPINVIVLVLGFVAVVGYALSRGVQLGLRIDRNLNHYLGTQLWVVLIFMVNGLTMFMFAGWNRLSRFARIAVVVSIVLFIMFQLTMGNRRDFLAMFIFLTGVVMTRRRSIIRARTVIFGGLAFAAFMAVGVVRQVLRDPSLLTRYNPLELVLTQNEFVTPVLTLMHYVNNARPLRWGYTYLSAPLQFIPRSIWTDKPESLSLQFMRDAFGTTGLIGFAYTPVTEAFLNFSWVGPFLVFSIFSLMLVKLVKNAHVHPGLYFILFALVVDFHRGEFAFIFYSLCFIGGAYAFQLLVSRIRWAPTEAMKAAARAPRPAPVLRS